MAEDSASSRHRRFDVWLACAVFMLSVFLVATNGFVPEDEVWFVQVVRRVLEGDVLYRDVAFGINPLSVYLGLPFMWMFGTEVLVLKVLHAAVFTCTALVAVRTVRRLGLQGRLAEVGLVAGLVACAPAGSTISLYTPLAMLFLLCALREMLRWIECLPEERATCAIRAGLWVGAAFASKQNVGVLAFVAVLTVLIVGRRSGTQSSTGDRWADVGRAVAAAAIVVVVVLIPVVVSGALIDFVDYGYLGKTTYLDVAGVDPFGTLRDWATALATSASLRGAYVFLSLQAAIVPVVAFGSMVALAPVWWRLDRQRSLVVLLFALAAYATAFPRADLSHVAGAVPVLAVAVVQAVSIIRMNCQRRVFVAFGTAVLVIASAGTATRMFGGIKRLVSPDYGWSGLHGIRGVLAQKDQYEAIEYEIAGLDRMLTGRDSTFLVSSRAGMISLVMRRANPTPFDYPFVTTLGSAGEDGLIARLESGRCRHVCIDTSGRHAGPLWPARFEAEVQRRFPRIDSFGEWELYAIEP